MSNATDYVETASNYDVLSDIANALADHAMDDGSEYEAITPDRTRSTVQINLTDGQGNSRSFTVSVQANDGRG